MGYFLEPPYLVAWEDPYSLYFVTKGKRVRLIHISNKPCDKETIWKELFYPYADLCFNELTLTFGVREVTYPLILLTAHRDQVQLICRGQKKVLQLTHITSDHLFREIVYLLLYNNFTYPQLQKAPTYFEVWKNNFAQES